MAPSSGRQTFLKVVPGTPPDVKDRSSSLAARRRSPDHLTGSPGAQRPQEKAVFVRHDRNILEKSDS